MNLPVILARCGVKLLMFRTKEEYQHAAIVYAETEIRIESEVGLVELHRELGNLLQGMDGFHYLQREFGVKSHKEINDAYVQQSFTHLNRIRTNRGHKHLHSDVQSQGASSLRGRPSSPDSFTYANKAIT